MINEAKRLDLKAKAGSVGKEKGRRSKEEKEEKEEGRGASRL